MAKGYYEEVRKGVYKMTVELETTLRVDGTKKRNRKTKTVSASGPRAMDKLLAAFVTSLEDTEVSNRIPFVKFVKEKWSENYAYEHLADTTIENYEYYTDSRIIPAFKDLWLDQITPTHCIEFLIDIQKEGMRLDGKPGKISPTTANFYHRILTNYFERAVEWGYIDENPMRNVKKQKEKKQKVSVYDEKQVHLAMENLWKEKLVWQCLIALDISTGMRREEILGIEERHFNYDEKTIELDQAIVQTKRKGMQISDLKTDDSYRTIHLSDKLAEKVKSLIYYKKRERLATGRNWKKGHNFIFSTELGKPFHPDYVSRWWRRYTEKNELDYIRFHALRHTSASHLINAGYHAKVIAKRLGHANIRTTMNIYGHISEKVDSSASESFDVFFDEKQKKSDSL